MQNAKEYAVELINKLESFKRIDFENEIPNPALSTDYLFGSGGGQMFGVLLCRTADGADKVLKAFSGQYNGHWYVPGWVNPILDTEEFTLMVEQRDPVIKNLGIEINSMNPGTPERVRLENKRRELSREFMHDIHAMYNIRNFKGDTTSLFELFKNRKGIPSGTGDCCAPKLLNSAVLYNLKPLGLTEFFYGPENKSGKRKHGKFYAPCEEKCGPLMGFMLQGSGMVL